MALYPFPSGSPIAFFCLFSLILHLTLAFIIPRPANPGPLSNKQLASAAGVIKGFLCISGKLIVKDPEHSDFRGCVAADGSLLETVSDSCPNFTVGKENINDPFVRVINVANPKHILYCEINDTPQAGDSANALALECQDKTPAGKPKLLWRDGILGAQKPDGAKTFNWAHSPPPNSHLALSDSTGYQLECENPVAESTTDAPQLALSKELKTSPNPPPPTPKPGPEYASTAPEHSIKLGAQLCAPGMLLLTDTGTGATKGCVTRNGKIIHPVSTQCNIFELGTAEGTENALVIVNLKDPKHYRYCDTVARQDMTLRDGTHRVAGTYINCKLERHPTLAQLVGFILPLPWENVNELILCAEEPGWRWETGLRDGQADKVGVST
ncbi:MAG: hypothetical protein M1829_006482 [Trizodia sp. TS-e1964]|nr:MAG: hypothetical protein M1829_006482 [Trizodia sp. TS-e1964]